MGRAEALEPHAGGGGGGDAEAGGGGPAREGREPLGELSRLFLGTHVTTVSFFRKEAAAAQSETVDAFLRARVAALLAANPWLAGRVEGRRELVYPRVAPAAAVDRAYRLAEEARIDAGTTDADMHRLLAPYFADPLGRAGALLRVTLFRVRPGPAPEGDAFALMISFGHSIGDGHTFYRLANMITGADPVAALSPTPKPRVAAAMRRIYAPGPVTGVWGQWGLQSNVAFGKAKGAIRKWRAGLAEGSWPARLGLGLPADRQHECRLFYLDEDYVARAKADAAAGGEVEYVSTNDVVASWFSRNLDVATMAINFRGRLEDALDTDAGNYVSSLPFGPADSARPALIRWTLQNGFRRAAADTSPLPAGLGWMGRTTGLLTSWASFAKPPRLPGAELELTFPYGDMDRDSSDPLKHNFAVPVGIVFRANDRLAMSVAGFPEVLERFEWTGSLPGEALDIHTHWRAIL